MKSIKTVFESTLDLDEGYKVGENIAFNVDGQDDTGIITKVSGETYTVKSNLTGKPKQVKAQYIMDAGNGLGANAATDAGLDGQV
jgi:hypothetical protein